MDATGPNAEQIVYWNETAGPKWWRCRISSTRKSSRSA
jgi:hypothetical protein